MALNRLANSQVSNRPLEISVLQASQALFAVVEGAADDDDESGIFLLQFSPPEGTETSTGPDNVEINI